MKKRLTIFASCFLVLALILTGCGASQEAMTGGITATNKNEMFDGFYGSADMEMEMAPSESPNKVETGATTNEAEQQQIKSQDKLVYTCNMTIETLEYKATMASIKEKINEFKVKKIADLN